MNLQDLKNEYNQLSSMDKNKFQLFINRSKKEEDIERRKTAEETINNLMELKGEDNQPYFNLEFLKKYYLND